ncbi:MAG: hypothetical protein QNK33_03090 [Bacteroidales bacterium]|nr:hypothetical protein [Bacteroidales bacterium]
MRKAILAILISLPIFSFGQDLDLIVTAKNDSIACKIDSLDSNIIYFTAKRKGHSLGTHLLRGEVFFYSYNSINRKNIKAIPGTLCFRTKSTQTFSSAKSVIGGTSGFLAIYIYGSMSYDYEISKLSFRNWQKLYLSVAGGFYNTWGDEGTHFSVRAIGLTGQKKGHIEAGGGFAVMMNKNEGSTSIIPAVHIGYRFQKPSGGIVFRAGFGIPEAIYLGLGYNF